MMTVPERTAYARTSTHAEVLQTVEALTAGSDLVHEETMLTTLDGKRIPLLILANPRVENPEQARVSGKPVIYIQGNIHGGEVEGKEAILILLREILHGDKTHLLDRQIIVLAPIYNADGNDNMWVNSRRSQELSPLMAGERLSHGFDLNRDGMAVERPETQGLYRNVLLRWDPDLLVDMHTTNGTWHGYSLTYAPSYHSTGDPATTDYTMNVMLPAIRAAVKEKFGLDFFMYGGFSLEQWPPTEFRTYNHAPRYLVNMMGLRNRMAILSETFAHDRFYKRIHSANVFIEEILEFTNEHGATIRRINREAEQRTMERASSEGPRPSNGVAFEMIPLEEPATILAYDHIPYAGESGEVKYARSAEMIEIDNVKNFQKFRSTRQAVMPRAYILPSEFGFIIDKLGQHGIEARRLGRDRTIRVQEFLVEEIGEYKWVMNRHRNALLSGKFRETDRQFAADDFVVSTENRLANLIFYLLEPEADDGLAFWNYFDEYLAQQNSAGAPLVYPVYKLID
jgi:dipeptidyl-peptidase-4